MSELLQDLLHEFQRHKDLADRAVAQLDDEEFFRRPAPHVNSVVIITKHLAGNLLSRWTAFLNTDGEKPNRDRDGEFVLSELDTRANLLEAWERGWSALDEAGHNLNDSDLAKSISIRGEPHTVRQALLRGMSHVAYHTGQLLYLVRLLQPEGDWLTVVPGKSREVPGSYRTRS